MEKLSVVICAYNPNQEIFKKVINSLKIQTLGLDNWELLIIDNNSSTAISEWLKIDWHEESRIILESKPGLIYARNRATIEAKYEYLVSVDDDTVLCSNYLELVQKIYSSDSDLGIIGGRSTPLYLQKPPKWISQFNNLLAIRDLGEKEIIDKMDGSVPKIYPIISPILIAPRKKCMMEYLLFFQNSSISRNLGRKGDSLASGEDNDINMFIYANGYKIGYFPDLKFEHIIPPFRTTRKYLSKMSYESNRSWVKMLSNHKINPWKPIKKKTVFLRKFKAFFKYMAMLNTPNYIRWRGACGLFKGLSEL